ncbi:T9SS type A sorting domain-containing protein [Spirosoma validum]|uniref:T9SS type A sorting domain-containing protein n=1 Tax=Spirosoma validum TaxID=2771355 RepID=A0A927GBL5_9BACT|nr:T9SS type A sorting domain-containing protein [Spirosoma validum]MBD2751600.1 T9SS type A sorting domain-containing protein [Spirosoma validum]
MSVSTYRYPNRVSYFSTQLLISLFLLVALTATAQSNWIARRPFNLSAITYKTGLFIGVGTDNTVAISTNGTTWMKSLIGTNYQLNGVTAGSPVTGVVAVGVNGIIFGSSNGGYSWSSKASPTTKTLNDVTYGGSLYVAVGENSTILTSSEGNTWTVRYANTPVPVALRGVTYSGSQFVAVGYGGVILTSPNGISWTMRQTNSGAALEDVAYGAGKYVAVGGYPSNAKLISTDGITWTTQLPATGTDYNLYDITYGNGQFVAVGYYGTVLTSPNAITWTKRYLGLIETMQGVVYANNQFITVGTSIRRSTDGTVWQATNAPDGQSNLTSAAYGNGRYVVIGNSYSSTSSAQVLISTDGVTFNRTEFPTYPTPSDVVFGQNLFVSVDYYGNILSSPDGVTWTFRKLGSSFKAITYGKGRYVAVGTGQAMVSTDGLTWTPSPPLLSVNFQDIAYGNGLFVAVGVNGAIYTSPDGLTWTSRVSNTTNTLRGIAYGNGYFVAVGSGGGNVRRSTDGFTWTGSGNSSGANTGSITFGNGQFVIAGNTSIMTTLDGLNPVPKSTPSSIGNLNTVRCLNWQFVAVGENGTILTSIADPMPFTVSGATLSSCDVMRPGTQYSPEIRAVRFMPEYSGTFTPPMSFSVTGLLQPTTNPDAIIYPAVDNPVVTIVAWDSQGRTASFAWNWLSRCSNGLRKAAEEVSKLQVVVLGNPTRNETVEVEISGVVDESVSLDVVNEQGILVSQQRIEKESIRERHHIQLGRATGLYVLKVQTPTQAQTVKLLKQ